MTKENSAKPAFVAAETGRGSSLQLMWEASVCSTHNICAATACVQSQHIMAIGAAVRNC